jgi:aspartyl/asparaginyl-tRNA synthetase
MNKRIYEQKITDPQDFSKMISKLRGFFIEKNYLETFPQPRLSILAACEDPKTVRSFNFDGNIWPLPQTSQMQLENILMGNSEIMDGCYCLTASYRDEPNPIEGRHLKSFCMFEAEHKGDFQHLISTLSELVIHLGFVDKKEDIPFFTYNELCKHYNTELLEAEHETMIWEEFGDVVGIIKFTEKTSPFFNMKKEGFDEETGEQLYNKCDLIICGQETFGSAERSSDIDQMRNSFHTISDGMYSKLLFDHFGEERVLKELEDYFELPIIDRWGFGCGTERLLRGMKLKGLI